MAFLLPRLRYLLSGILLLSISSLVLASTDGWISATPLPDGVVITDMACDPSGLCVAVGLGGSILTSTVDGLTWTRQDSHTVHRLYDVVYVDSVQGFWIVGEGGVIIQGTADGLTWTIRESGTRKALFGIADGVFTSGSEVVVAVGQQGVLLVSLDKGLSWQVPDKAGLPTIFPSYNAVDFIGDRFIAIGSSRAIVQSFDGLTWAEALDDQGQRLYLPQSLDLNEVTRGTITGGVTRYVVVGENGAILTSDDAVQWQTSVQGTQADQELLSVTWDGGRFVAGGVGGRFVTSADGVSWVDVVSPSGTATNINEVHWDPSHNRYLIAGSQAADNKFTGGFISLSDPNSLAVWNPVSTGSTGIIINGIQGLDPAGSDAFVAVTSSGVLLSADGNAWTIPTTPPPAQPALNAVTVSGSRLLAVGQNGGIFSSPDAGQTWSGPVTPAPTASQLNGVTENATVMVAVGDAGTILRSLDGGANWLSPTQPPTGISGINLTGVTWTPALNLFVAVGTAATIVTSADGDQWSPPLTVPSPVAIGNSGGTTSPVNNLHAVAWVGTQLIAVGEAGWVIRSSDGVTWTGGRATEIPGNLHAITTDGVNIVVAGSVSPTGISPLSGAATTAIWMSSDGGQTWAGHEKLGAETLLALAWNGTQYAAGGVGGLLVVSGGLDVAVNPILNATVDTTFQDKTPIPTRVAEGSNANYRLTVTNNGNIDVPVAGAVLTATFAPGSQYIWGGATITVKRVTSVITCDTTQPLKSVCQIPEALKVFPLPKGQTQQNRPKEGVDVTVTVLPSTTGTLAIDFAVTTPGLPGIVDQNSVNSSLHAVTTVLSQQEILCNPDTFLSSCVSNVADGTGGSGGGAISPWVLLALALPGGLVFPRRFGGRSFP